MPGGKSRKPAVPFIVDGTERCGAKTYNGGRCKRYPMNGTHRCRNHGGASALANMGSGNPAYKHGRYMINPKKGFVERMETLMSDKDLRGLNSEIALITYRVEELLDTQGNPGALWKDAKKTHEDIMKGVASEDSELAGEALRSLGEIIEGGMKLHEAWAEIYTAVELRRKLVDSAHKHEMQMGLMLTATEWTAGAGRLLEATKNVVRILTEAQGQYDYEAAMQLVADEFDTKLLESNNND